MTVLVTGVAGFIGYHLARKLLIGGESVIGFDNINPYYDPALKRARLARIEKLAKSSASPFSFIEGDLVDSAAVEEAFCNNESNGAIARRGGPMRVVHLAAQAGVRYSIKNPAAYIQSNLVGFGNILEACRNHSIEHLVYASSSSVYGGNTALPFSEYQSVEHPVSLYAATKKANELMAHAYSHLYAIPCTGLRFFTVYGPWGRPDMALFLFTKAILEGRPIHVYNYGRMIRDFTYIDDVIESLLRLLKKPATPDPSFSSDAPNPGTSWAPHRVFNIGNSSPKPLIEYIEAIENALGVKAVKEFLPLQPGDVLATAADASALEAWIGCQSRTSINEGVEKFVRWYRSYYG